MNLQEVHNINHIFIPFINTELLKIYYIYSLTINNNGYLEKYINNISFF